MIINHDQIGDSQQLDMDQTSAGNVSVENCEVGISSTIKQKIKVSSGVTIGSASNVVKNCQKNKIYYGILQKNIKKKLIDII